MKVRLKLLLIMGLLLWEGLASAQAIDVPDPNLESALRKALDLAAGQSLTQAEMLRLERFDARERGIVNLTGMEHAINVTWLALWNNEITDLRPLAGLIRLEVLYLWGNSVSDIAPLSNLALLTDLNLAGNGVSDITPLENLTQLERLNLGWNNIEDIRPLAHLIKLHSLRLTSNRIVDISPLANLTELEELWISGNQILDFSSLNGLSLTVFERDEFCQFPPVPVEPRFQNRTYPSIFNAWDLIENLPRLSRIQLRTYSDLYWSAQLGLDWLETEQGVEMAGNLDEALAERDAMLALNPNMLFLVEVRMRDAFSNYLPADSPYWVRDAAGNRVVAIQHTINPNLFLIDFTHPDVQDMIVNRTIALSKCGLYDGVFFDWWSETGVVLADSKVGWKEGYRGFEAEQRARDNVIQRIRAEVRPEFLVMGNGNRRTFPRNAHYMNGSFMETGRDYDGGYTHEGLMEIETSLLWLEQNLRSPQINCLEGWGIPTEPPDSQDNRRFMRVFTTMSLTHSDGYVMYNNGKGDHKHYWYDFWDADLGRPIGPTGETHGGVEGLFIREFTNGWAVYNRSGNVQSLSLPGLGVPVSDRPEGGISTTHQLPDLDGEMYLRVVVDQNGDGRVNILDLILVARGFGTPSGDVNRDGVTNILDLTLVAQQFE